MTTKKARDFLDKELFIERNVVTFRSLSRELGIHVNDAKNELKHYHDAVRDTDAPAVPTYLVSGEVPPLTASPRTESQRSDSAMDVDLEFEADREETDVVRQSKVLLVDARALDETVAQFSRVCSVHVYSLSPSRLGDAGFVCAPTLKVREADVRGGPASFPVYGKIAGPHVKLKAGSVQSVASSSRTTLDMTARALPKAVAPTREQQPTKGDVFSSTTKEKVSTTTMLPKTESHDRLKPSGKLDWSKAKTKEKESVAEKKREEKKPMLRPDSTIIANDPSASKKLKVEPTKSSIFKSESSDVASGDARKRGVKRKPYVDTELESDSESSLVPARPSTATGSSLKKGVMCPDDDDDDDGGKVRIPGQRRARRSTMTSDSEMSLRAMMDIDDERVDRVSRVSRVSRSNVYARREESEESSEDMDEPKKEATAPPITSEDDELDELDDVPVVQKKRKPRKVVPVGRNGLKKRRVLKSRTTTDAKGYMQTEDYSSYESVEEEEELETKPKGKAKQTKKASEPMIEEARPKVVAKEESAGKLKAKPAPKPRGGAPKRGGLLNFFGPEKGKK